METNKNTCKWKEAEDEGVYETSCRKEIQMDCQLFFFFEDDYKFCPYCGKRIKEVKNGNE